MNTFVGNNSAMEMNQGKSFTISIVAHLLILAVAISSASNIEPAPKLMVIDFSILESPVQTKTSQQTIKQPAVPSPPVRKPPDKVQIPPPKPVVSKKVAKKRPKPVSVKKPTIAAIKQKAALPVETEPKPMPEPELITEAVPGPEITHPEPEPQQQEPLLAQSTPALVTPVETALKSFYDFAAPAAGKSLVKSDKSRISQYTKAQFNHIQEGIQRHINYPRMARRMGWEGKVVVEFIICGDGTVKNIQIVESSGIKALDKNAVATIKKSAPFPIPPIPAKLIIPVVYRLS